MMGLQWSISYPSQAKEPWWGQPGSHMNFCEADYQFTRYIAELVNTLTNIGYVLYAIHGIRRFKYEGVQLFSPINLPYLGLACIGLCSAVYHATLQYHTQMADEMSMHFAMGCVLIQLWTWRRPLAQARRNAALIVIGLTSFIIYHCVTDEFTLHVILFFGMSVSVAWKIRKITRETITDPVQKQKLGRLGTFCTCIALFAYFLWNIDVHCCPTLTRWKRQVGLPWGVLLEFHGIWHILTAISTYGFMAMIEFLTAPDINECHGVGFSWPAKAVLRDLVPDRAVGASVHTKGHANGLRSGHSRDHARGAAEKRLD